MNKSLQGDFVQSALLAPADRIDLLCDAFEDSWRRGEKPCIKDYLYRCETALQDGLFMELLLIDRELRVRQGQPVTRQDYHNLFPEFSSTIESIDLPTIDNRGGLRRTAAEAQTARIQQGGTLAHFQLLEELGSGASGTVWKAFDTRLQRHVGLKIPKTHHLSPQERERFLREGQACAQLHHPRIVPVYEVGEAQGNLFIVVKLIEGGNLHDLLKHRKLTHEVAADLVIQLAEALHHAHEFGVIHRDVKPANVLIDSEGAPHLADFGLAKCNLDNSTPTVAGDLLGTPAYMSPEQARGESFQVDRRTDVYGLGVLLYELLTGHPPFQGEMAALFYDIVHVEPQSLRNFNSRVPQPLETICLKALEKDPDRRYQSAQKMAEDLQRFLRNEPILAIPVGRVRKLLSLVRRRPALAIALALAGTLVIAVAAYARLAEQNIRLQGYRNVRIATNPPGALIAIVPIDARTNELRSHCLGIVRPSQRTPVTAKLKPGDYFIEAVLPRKDSVDFSEVRRSVPQARTSISSDSFDEDKLVLLEQIEIRPLQEVTQGMVKVPIHSELRIDNSLLPSNLIVDCNELSPLDSVSCIQFTDDGKSFVLPNGAADYLEKHGKRLPTVAEYLALAQACEVGEATTSETSSLGRIQGLQDELPEWTTSRYYYSGKTQHGRRSFNQHFILMGYSSEAEFSTLTPSIEGKLLGSPADESPQIGFRGVRSGAPRFVKL